MRPDHPDRVAQKRATKAEGSLKSRVLLEKGAIGDKNPLF
jgi:hypothetical protein